MSLCSADFGLGQICRGCGECTDCVPCPVPDKTTPAPSEGYTEEGSETLEEGSEDDGCSACSNLSEDQLAVLGTYDNGGKRVVCDPTCLDDSYDRTQCNCKFETKRKPDCAFHHYMSIHIYAYIYIY